LLDELHALLEIIIALLMKMLTLRPLQAAAITYRIAFGPRAACRLDAGRLRVDPEIKTGRAPSEPSRAGRIRTRQRRRCQLQAIQTGTGRHRLNVRPPAEV
jgi:hypothetical protein